MKLLTLLALCCLVPGTTAGTPSAPTARGIAIPFDPPVASRLVYRGERASFGETTRRPFGFALEFERTEGGYIMTVQSGDGSRRDPTSIEPAFVRQRFSLTSDGELVAMLDEPAYWRALEALLEADVRAAPGDRDVEGALWAMRQQRALPTRERLHALADDAAILLLYAGSHIQAGEHRRDSFQDTVVGPMVSEERVTVERISADAVLIRKVRAMPASAIEQLRRNYDPSQPGIEGRVVAFEATSMYEVDRRTGLVRMYRVANALTTEQGGERRTVTSSETLRLVE